MAEVTINLDPDRGGKIEFAELPTAILWCQRQRDTWKVEMVGPNLKPEHPMWLPYHAWEQLRENLQHSFDNVSGGDIERQGTPDLIVERSPVYLALKWVKERVTVDGLEAAATVAGLGSKRIDWMAVTESVSVLMYERALREFLSADGINNANVLSAKWIENQEKAGQAEDRISLISQNIESIASAINNVEQREKDTVEQLGVELRTLEITSSDKMNEIRAQIETLAGKSSGLIAQLLSDASERIATWTHAYEEERQLQAPVVLWNSRAEYHEERLRTRQSWMIGIGTVGLLCCVAVAIGTFLSTSWLFGDAVEPAAGTAAIGSENIKAIFKYQLLTTSATTLLFLTMYIWAMKLLVRLYSTEHHLAIDAKGRAALTETYLGLTKEGKATDADRAIMLAVLFRPVADGLVKEDNPPAISPAAIIAGLASSPAK